jgi:Kef-type K+ transport system membrane component KefB
MNERQRAAVPFLLLAIGLAGTILVSAVWLIFNRPEPVLIGTFGSLTSSGLTLIALEEIRALRDDLRKDRDS